MSRKNLKGYRLDVLIVDSVLNSVCFYFVILPTPEAILPLIVQFADVCAAVSGAAAAPSQADTQSEPTTDIFCGGLRRGFSKGTATEGQDNSSQSWAAEGRMADRDAVPLPAEVRAKLAELELELSEGE